MKVQIKTAPVQLPLEMEIVKTHLRISEGQTNEDLYLDGLIKASQNQAEQITGRKLISQTWYYYRDNWPCNDYYSLPFPPLSTGTAPIVTYKDIDSSTVTLSSSAWVADSANEPGRIYLDYNESWPSESLHTVNPIKTEFVCGYGDASSDIPQGIRHAMLLMIGHWYENREDSIVGQGFVALDIPRAANALLYPYRVWNDF